MVSVIRSGVEYRIENSLRLQSIRRELIFKSLESVVGMLKFEFHCYVTFSCQIMLVYKSYNFSCRLQFSFSLLYFCNTNIYCNNLTLDKIYLFS